MSGEMELGVKPWRLKLKFSIRCLAVLHFSKTKLTNGDIGIENPRKGVLSTKITMIVVLLLPNFL